MRHKFAVLIGSMSIVAAAICSSTGTAEAIPPWRCYTCSITYHHPTHGPVTLHAGDYSTSISSARALLIDKLQYAFTQGWGVGLPVPPPSLVQWALQNMSCAFTPQFLPDTPRFLCQAEALPPDLEPAPGEPQEPPQAPYCEPDRLQRECMYAELVEERLSGQELCTAWIEPPYRPIFVTQTPDRIVEIAESVGASVRWDDAFCATYDPPDLR